VIKILSFVFINLGKLPHTVYIQIDGGSENANKLTLAMMCLIVAKATKLGCQQLFLTRLPPGHTHEDCDAQFGVIWKATRNKPILSPAEYKAIVEECLGKSLPVRVIDMYNVPDYVKFFEDCIDPDIKK
jgi:hypothetical protein